MSTILNLNPSPAPVNTVPELVSVSVSVPAPPTEPVRRPRRDEYRGNPLLVLPMGRDREFSFGRGKAQTILEHLDAIREFVAEIGV